MATVQSSRSRKYEAIALAGDEPTLHVESEGERLIQDLSAKQLNTNLTLEQQKNQEIQFERGTGFVPLSAYSSGSSSLKDLKRNIARNDSFAELRGLDLTKKEAEAIVNGADLTFPQSKVEPSIKEARAQDIRMLLDTRPDRSSLVTQLLQDERNRISRHERELALAVKPDSAETKLFRFALSCNSHAEINNQPLHSISIEELAKEFMNTGNDKYIRTIIRKRHQTLDSLKPPCGPKYMKRNDGTREGSLWDQEMEPAKKPIVNRNLLSTCKNRGSKMYTIKNGEIVEVNKKKCSTDNQSSNEEIQKRLSGGEQYINMSTGSNASDSSSVSEFPKMTIAQIKKIPKFKDYDIGAKSKVLYLKNLNKNVKEEDLVQLFSRFNVQNEPSIIYRLMTGRMHGQAFVTFPNDNIAEKALKSTNFCILYGNPIVIQYGKNAIR